jgi:hypothetical protein
VVGLWQLHVEMSLAVPLDQGISLQLIHRLFFKMKPLLVSQAVANNLADVLTNSTDSRKSLPYFMIWGTVFKLNGLMQATDYCDHL